ncbi:hypothetical protein [Exiguobacterium mexicanum]|uniref:hypothetical protein n=1 Tax=Exiguobacterium mexicanum TaxID=340146 RepID=UPI0037BF73FC
MSKRYFYEKVRQFHETFGHPEASAPQPLELDRAVKRSVWTAEEAVVEFLHQSARNEAEFLEAVATFQQGFEQAVQKSLQDAPPNGRRRAARRARRRAHGCALLRDGQFRRARARPGAVV